MNDHVIETIVKLLHLFQMVNMETDKFNKRKNLKRNEIEQKIKLEHTIRSLSHTFLLNELNKRYSVVEKEMDKEFYEGLVEDKDFIDATTKEQREIYKKYLEFLSLIHI